MDKNKKSKKVFFADGFPTKENHVGIISYLYELSSKDVEFSRFYFTEQPYDAIDNWWHRDIKHDVVSIAYDDCWWLLGKRGIVISVIPNTVTPEEIISEAGTGPGKYGYLNKIKKIGNDLYVCGYLRQVYKRAEGKWVAIDKDIRASQSENGVGFYDIDGTGPDNIYAVGHEGEIFHYDGKKWTSIESPTNVLLECVRCVTNDFVYICGEEGVVLKGNKTSLEVIDVELSIDEDDDLDEITFTSIDIFKGEVYLSYSNGLLKFRKNKFIPVEMNLKSKIDSCRLHANEDMLWSFGEKHIVNFDGEKWREVFCPDNDPGRYAK